jgi:hypothetical protein
MTEDQIERQVEAQMDSLDRRYLNSPMTEAQYKAAVRKIDRWAAEQLRLARAQRMVAAWCAEARA